MTDDWGFVMTPKGPEGDYVTVFSDNIAVIPSCYDAETANKIAFAYDLYTNPTLAMKMMMTGRHHIIQYSGMKGQLMKH